MAHTDRQPSDEIFNDIKATATSVWYNYGYQLNLHDEYVEEKIKAREHITNYADNWAGFIQQFDTIGQIMFMDFLRRKDSLDFLIEQHAHYSYRLPRVKE